MKQLSLTAVLLATLLMPLSAQAVTAITWVGGVGSWDSAGAWDAGNGAESALEIFSRDNGWDSNDGPANAAITIGGSGSVVVYDQTALSGSSGDLRLRERTLGNSASLTVQDGAVFELQSSVHFEGTWTEFDSGPVNVTGAGSVLKRTHHGAASTAGGLVLGSWISYDGQEIELNVEDGGRLENNGQIWFGSLGENGSGIEVVVNIDGGHIDNTNGSVLIGDSSGIGGEIKFNYGFNKDESYAINFGDSGSITVDAAGIRIQEETAPGVYNSVAATYEELWNRGILQAYGLTVQDGVEFDDYFRVEGQSGSDDYTLVRVPEPTLLVTLDIKPGSDPSPVNLKSKGVLPVAVLSTDEFDAQDIDLTSLLFGDPLLLDDGGTAVSPLRSTYEDVSGDGLLDLTLKFSTADLVEYEALGPDTVEGLLTGALLDGTPIEGMDSIRIVPPNGSNGNGLQISTVPEPTTCTLALAALCLALSRRRIAAR